LFRAKFNTQPTLLHLAQVLLRYHEQEAQDPANSESPALVEFETEVVRARMVDALESYSAGLGAKVEMEPEHHRFQLFSGNEFTTRAFI
jgi:hypothetical protein